MNYKKFFYFDLETVSFYKDFDTFNLQDARGANIFKDRCNRRKNSNDSYNQSVELAYADTAALVPEYGKIVAIAFAYFEGDQLKISSKTIENDDEKPLIEWISRLFKKVDDLGFTVTGHNIKGFDIPYIVKKLTMYGFKVPACLNTLGKKPWEIKVMDTMDMWKGTSWENSFLDELTWALDILSPKDEMSGADVREEYWQKNNIEGIGKYCKKDVKVLVDICKKIQYSQG
jgi:DNA polymerase elongation subunit (family B)